ncbi:hypothetical protein SDC9_99412 [bioreactor metagenome]|uniref:Uncharacterized protein n=1 Tax=bioreactor metagenome TaxID=1076179 RepID=A0A645AHG5_9ZZZZ
MIFSFKFLTDISAVTSTSNKFLSDIERFFEIAKPSTHTTATLLFFIYLLFSFSKTDAKYIVIYDTSCSLTVIENSSSKILHAFSTALKISL